MINGIQIAAVIFSLIMIYITFLHSKKKELSLAETLFFFIIWIGAIILTIFPNSANFIMRTFKIYRLLDLATIVGFMILAGLIFKDYLEIKKLKNKVERIIRQKSLKDLK